MVDDLQSRGQSVISVDTKKKELVGDFKNAGREWQPKGEPVPVRAHDFIDPVLGKAIPYGVYDIARNVGWVNVGVDHDTPSFAVRSIGDWWRAMGKRTYPDTEELLITADSGGSNSGGSNSGGSNSGGSNSGGSNSGGSNSARSKLWKVELQRFCDNTGLVVHVCHFPPGTSKWNKIEHRMFCHITQTGEAALIDHQTVVQLIGGVRTTTGLRVRARLDLLEYPTDIKDLRRNNEDSRLLSQRLPRRLGPHHSSKAVRTTKLSWIRS